MSNDINLAALWVPVMASTAGLKGQLEVAGAEGAAVFGRAFMGSSIFKDIGAAMQGALTAGAPEGRRAIDLLTAGHRDLTKAADDTAAAATRASSVFNTLGVASVVAFGGAIAISAKAAGDFQASMTRLQASAGESADNLKTVGDGILQLAGKVGYGAQDLANAMYTVEKAGYRGADGVNVLTAAAQGAKSENADLKEVLSGLTTSMNDFNYTPAQAADVMSKMVAAVGMAKSNFQDFSGALHSVEPAAAAVHMSLADVYGSLAQITQSGTSPAQAAENMAHAIQTLSKPTQQMRDEMGQFGLNAVNVQEQLGQRGLAGTMQFLSNTIRDHMDPAGKVVVDTMYKNEQATASAKQIFDALPPAAQKVAQSVKDGGESYKAFRKDRGGLDVEQANEVQQWLALNNKITGYSTALKTGQGSVQTYLQALSLMVGGQDAARIALQLTGENADKTNKGIQEIDQTTREHDGTVKGFNETQTTLNAKMADFKAAMGAARIELGTAFLPVLTDVAGALATVGQFLAAHKDLAENLTTDVGLLAGAWLLVKGAMIGKDIWMGIAGAMDAVGTKTGIAATATKELGVAETTVATESAAAAGGIDLVGTSAATAQTGVAGLSRLLGPLMAAFLVMQNGPDIQKWIEDHVPGGKFLDSLPNPGDAGKASRDWVNQHIFGDTPPGPTADATTTSPAATNDMRPKAAPPPYTGPPIPPGAAIAPPTGAAPPAQWTTGPVPGAAENPLLFPYAHAAGGIFGGSMPSSAKIQPGSGSGLIQWAEQSTGGEAYIPLSGGAKSKSIWAQTGHLLGIFDQGGFNGADAAGGDTWPVPYGLPPGTNSGGYGGGGAQFPAWVNQVSDYFGIKPSTYPGHQESNRSEAGFAPNPQHLNRAIDWSGPVDAMQRFADYLKTIPQDLEQVIWQNPNTGQKVGIAGGQDVSQTGYYGADYAEHGNHVHTRQSMSIPLPGQSGYGPQSGGYYMPDDKKVEAAQTRIDKLQGDIQVLEQRKSEETDKTKQSEKDRIDNELKTKNAELDAAKESLDQAEQGTYRASKSGSRATGKNTTEGQAQQFASGMLKGVMSDLGFGNVLGGKSPLDWGITKLAGGLASWGLGEANWVGDALSAKQGGQQGSGGNILSGALSALPGLKGLMPHGGIPLGPSQAAVPMADPNGSVHGGSRGAAPGPVSIDNSITVSGNTMSDPYQMAAPIREINNAQTASRAGGSSGGVNGNLPMPVG